MKQPQTQQVGNAAAEAMNTLAKERRLEDDHRANLDRLTEKCKRLEAELAEADKAVKLMAEDGWLFCGPEGLSEAQQAVVNYLERKNP
jgi:hypothetical protein